MRFDRDLQHRHRRVRHVLSATLLVLVLARPAVAHELGTTRVAARFPADGTFALAVAMDASALLARLEVARHQLRSSPDSAGAYQARFESLCDDVVSHAVLTFDGRPAASRATCLVDSADPSSLADPSLLGITVTLVGRVPSDARTFRWRFDLTVASYLLTAPATDGESNDVWLEGSDESPALALNREPPPLTPMQTVHAYFRRGVVHVVPNGIGHVLLVIGLYLLSRRLWTAIGLVSVFTVAYAIALAFTVRGLIAPPPTIFNPLIPLSIVGVALANVSAVRNKPWLALLVLACGLLQGSAGAGALHELSLPGADLWSALVGFNLGIEAGEVSVVGLGWLVLGGCAFPGGRQGR